MPASTCCACSGRSADFCTGLGSCLLPTAPASTPAAAACSHVANQPRVLPAVVRFLSDGGYAFDSPPDNPGVVIVSIGCR